ncbi:sensor histidine kinase [Flavihumibacter sp. CACIAM 22H1]|uniref:sensor histidine kinase n=1 Tax=Flavihumibacter sp. CACIAM 22H1 TaxID=1812911 RepID=UPI0007A92750|nr:sensor histidine kinase [Flavihumibacter sp. CACIAM 22H1]KYP14126.1 MAG: hypothetical protein A1D16_19945 [Flavihumibacter sp. CACIAM 22H1]
MPPIQTSLLKLASSKTAVHLLFCTAFIALCFLPVAASPYRTELIPRAAFVCVFFLGTAYMGRGVCKSYLLTGRIKAFIIATLLATVCIAVLFSFFLFISDLQRGWSSLTFGIPLVVLFFSMGIFLTTARDSLRKQLAAAAIAERQKQSELELLRSQLSPHFLFNTLNNLYGLAFKKDQQLALLIVKLSDLLRYSLSDINRRFVPIEEELNYISSYMELEKIRLGDKLQLRTNLPALIPEMAKMPPMLLIVFVENAFKHSKKTYEATVFIDLELEVSDNYIRFSIINSCGNAGSDNKQEIPELGMGLSNTQRRLELLYGNSYTLQHYKKEDRYFVYLEIPNLKDGDN